MNTRRTIFVLSLCLMITILLAACQPNPSGTGVLQSKIQRGNPVTSQEDQTAVVDGTNQFATDLYQVINDRDGNLLFSPLSISMALSMTYGGARGATAEQMASILHLPQDRDTHAIMNWLDQELESRANGPEGKRNSGFELSIANSIWGQIDFPFLSEYIDLLAANYGAGMRVTDFVNQPEPSRLAINRWVSNETHKKIPELFSKGMISSDTRMVLANAVYFNAPWKNEFKKSETQTLPFTLLDGSQVNTEMMHAKRDFGYNEGQGFRAVSLPYRGDEVAMMIILPDEGTFQSFDQGLNAEQISMIVDGMSQIEVNLTLPRFQFDTELDLGDSLPSLGMVDAFDSHLADFSGMDGARDLFISDAIHKAYIDVNEEGTEAAAATGIVIKLTSLPIENVVLVDRPFIFAIYDKVTGSILFLGRVVNPVD